MWEQLLTAGISAGGSLLSSLLGGSKSLSPRKQIALQKDFLKWQWANQGEQLKGLRDGAEAAGFNPLTVLGSGSAGYQTTHLPQLADFGGINAGMAISDAVQSGLAAYSAFSPAEDAMYQKADENHEKNKSFVGNDTSITGPSAGVVASKLPKGWEAGKASVTNPWNKGNVMHSVADAETAEARYGDVAGSVYGLGVAAADLWENYGPDLSTPSTPWSFSSGGGWGIPRSPDKQKFRTGEKW